MRSDVVFQLRCHQIGSMGRIPANVLLNDRASVTAGFANEVEAVNQYAAASRCELDHRVPRTADG